jgi:predicted DNA-binding transcriptional regulator YafY
MSDIDREIMRLLPEAGDTGGYISTPDLHRRLEQTIPDAPSCKTVFRHLDELELHGLVERERRGTAVVWRRKKGASGMAAKAGAMMTFDEALALQTLRRFSSRQIPELVAEMLAPMFEVADMRLQRTNNEAEKRYARWAGKVAVESGGFALQSPPIDRAMFGRVTHALFEERKLDIVYRARQNGGKEKAKVVLPLGLVEVGALVYLIAGMEGKPSPTMYRMDRLASAEVMLESFEYPAGFSLDAYVKKQRSFDFRVGEDVRLELRFTDCAGDHLLEAPLSVDQTAERVGDALIVRGTVMSSQRLRWWLRSFGPNVEVLGPGSLREEFVSEVRRLARVYG